MNLRKNIISSLLLAIGFVFHALIPGFYAGVKPDFMLVFMVIAILIHPTRQNTILVSLMGGILTAFTTSMAGGQLANIIDKAVTCLFLYMIIRLCKGRIRMIGAMLLGGSATLVSGGVFLFILLITLGLPMGFTLMFLSIVVPTALINIPLTGIVYYALDRAIVLKKGYANRI